MSGWERMTGSAVRFTQATEYRVSLLGHPPSRYVASNNRSACQKWLTAAYGTVAGFRGCVTQSYLSWAL